MEVIELVIETGGMCVSAHKFCQLEIVLKRPFNAAWFLVLDLLVLVEAGEHLPPHMRMLPK